MRIPRIFTPQVLTTQSTIELDDAAANHVSRVLRMGPSRKLFLFNGKEQCHFEGEIISAQRKNVSIKVLTQIDTELESPLHIHLGQAISKGDRMDFTIQKSVELGINEITPLWTKHVDVKLNSERLEKKLNQWRQIAIAACEQSGRDKVPVIHAPQELAAWLKGVDSQERWVLDPRGLKQDSNQTTVSSACLLIGPEGGLSEQEIKHASESGFKAKLIGPRVLRTETAALTAISLLQSQWGDF